MSMMTTMMFGISMMGMVLNSSHTILILVCMELMLLSMTLNFVINSVKLENMSGQIYALYLVTVAAVETAMGLSILMTFYKMSGSISMKIINLLKG